MRPEDKDDRCALAGTRTRRGEELWQLSGVNLTVRGRSTAVHSFQVTFSTHLALQADLNHCDSHWRHQNTCPFYIYKIFFFKFSRCERIYLSIGQEEFEGQER